MNWFDDRTWYPLGRIVGGTIYPGLLLTASAASHILHALNLTVNIRNICVLLAPVMAGFTAMTGYAFTKEVLLPTSGTPSPEQQRLATCSGLFAAVFLALAPGYMSRSVGGSFDNEAVAIWALVFTFWMWVRAVKRGSAAWAAVTALSYFYMASAWGGYVFITNIIPIHALVLVATGRFSARLYIAYCSWYALGTLAAMQVPFVGFQPMYGSEHFAAMGMFCLLQLAALDAWMRDRLSEAMYKRLRGQVAVTFVTLGGLAFAGGVATGFIAPWSGRLYSLLDPTYAKKHIPIIASVSEHQPTAWTSYWFDLHIVAALVPVGVWMLFRHLGEGTIFLLSYTLAGVYFSGIMVRLMLTLTPAACMCAGIAAGHIATSAADVVARISEASWAKPASRHRTIAGFATLGVLLVLCSMYARHCIWAGAEVYSNPSVLLGRKLPDGSKSVVDDFREAYSFLRRNAADKRIAHWWDYGHQVTGLSNLNTITDGTTSNNTHIATIGRILMTPEEEGLPVLRSLDIDYIFVLCGGYSGYSGDDVNKALWPVRIGRGVWPHMPPEADYYSPTGSYVVGDSAGKAMRKSLLYAMCYEGFGQLPLGPRGELGFDRARRAIVSDTGFNLKYVKEAYTTSNWIVRIFKVMPQTALDTADA